MFQLTSCKAQPRSPSSTRDYSGSQPASIERHDPHVRSDGQLNRQIPSEWPENTDSLDTMPGRCTPLKDVPGKKKKHSPPGCLKMMQTPPRWHKEASNPSGMA